MSHTTPGPGPRAAARRRPRLPRVPTPTPSVRSGRRGGEPLLLLHPFMCNHDVWTDVLPGLGDDFDVVAVTLPGHWGGPHLPRRAVSVEAFADGVEQVLDELGWDTCHVAGNSIGGWLALELARRGRARSVVAIAPAGGWRRFSPAQLLVGLRFLAIAPLALFGHVTGDLGRSFPPARRLALGVVSARPSRVPRERADDFIRAASNCSAFLPYVWSDLRRGGLRDPHEITAPLRLVLCDDDWLLPPSRYAATYLAAWPEADVVRVPDVGHIPMFDDPDLVADLVAGHALAHASAARHADTA